MFSLHTAFSSFHEHSVLFIIPGNHVNICLKNCHRLIPGNALLPYRLPRNSRRFSRVFREKPEWNGVRPIREANSAWANASYCHAPRGGVYSNNAFAKEYMPKKYHWLIPESSLIFPGKCTCKTAEGEKRNEKAPICPDYVPYHDSSAHLVRKRGSYTRKPARSARQ